MVRKIIKKRLLINDQSSMTVSPIIVPNLFDSTTSLHVLREKCDASKILGLIRYKRNEILLVYDGPYISTYMLIRFPTSIYLLLIFQNLVVTLTITAYLSVQLVTFLGSAEPQRMLIVEPTSCCSRPIQSRYAAWLLASSFR